MSHSSLHGILIVDKPRGLSSMATVSRVRRSAGGVKTGHGGTLDPLAEGVLVIALGKATKLIDRALAADKRYRTTIDLSAFTTTDDLEGERSEVAVAQPPDEGTVREVLEAFVGEIMQRPPAFSAMKIGGRRAYKLARGGTPVELPERPVVVHGIELLSYRWPLLEIAIHSGKGFYVRSLARDVGVALATGGHCVKLRRTAVGSFTEAMAIALHEVPQPLLQEHLIAIE